MLGEGLGEMFCGRLSMDGMYGREVTSEVGESLGVVLVKDWADGCAR